MERFTFFDDVVKYVEDAINIFEFPSDNYDCETIAEHVTVWDEDLQKFVLIKSGDDFWAEVAAHALA